MQQPPNSFDTNYNLAIIHVEKLPLLGQEVYRVEFSNEVPTTTVVCNSISANEKNWDTVPPGNKELATLIGGLIENYLNEATNE